MPAPIPPVLWVRSQIDPCNGGEDWQDAREVIDRSESESLISAVAAFLGVPLVEAQMAANLLGLSR
jgi:hypothetical protein